MIEMGALALLAPALVCGKADGSVRTKSGFAMTVTANDVVSGAGAEAVVA